MKKLISFECSIIAEVESGEYEPTIRKVFDLMETEQSHTLETPKVWDGKPVIIIKQV